MSRSTYIKACCYLLCWLVSSSALFSQQLPLNQQAMNDFNALILQSDNSKPVFTGYRSMDFLELQYSLDSASMVSAAGMFGMGSSVTSPQLYERLQQQRWIRLQKSKTIITIDPVVEAMAGRSNLKNGILWNGTAGAQLRGVIKNKFSFGIGAYTSISEFPAYVDRFISQNNDIVPGQHQSKKDEHGRYHYSSVDAYVTYVPDKHLLLSAGYGKQFLGDGYRSLLLSDNAFNYPYVRLRASFLGLNYNVMYSYLENDRVVDDARQGKYSVNHYLSANIGKRLQVSLFENIIWVARDTNYQRGFDVQYINPFTFLRPVEFSLGSPDNSFFGLNWKYLFPDKGYVYGQIALDDVNIGQTAKNKQQHINNKYGIQLGVWMNNIVLKDLSWRVEWNAVRPYMYGHRKIEQNYTHNHQSLAHPFGANFHEFLSIINYRHRQWYGILHNALVIRGEDDMLTYNNGDNLWGGEAGVPKLGSKTMQGVRHNYWYNKFSFGYMINPLNRLSIQADVIFRKHASDFYNESEFYYGIGITTRLFNKHDDI